MVSERERSRWVFCDSAMKKSLRLHVRTETLHSVLHEWFFDNPKLVTAGILTHASIWLPDPKAPPRELLFLQKGGKILFRLPPRISASLLIGGKQISVHDLRDAGLILTDPQGEFIALSEKSRGTIVLGSTELHFWFSASPKQLEYTTQYAPPNVLRNIQPALILTLIMSLAIHWAIYRLLKFLPSGEEPTVVDINRRYARLDLPDPSYIETRFGQKRSTMPRATDSKDQKTQTSSSSSKAGSAQKPGGITAAQQRSGNRFQTSPFARLFANDPLTQNLDYYLSGKSLEHLSESTFGRAGKNRGRESSDHAEGTRSTLINIGSLKGASSSKVSIDPSHLKISSPLLSRLSNEPLESEGILNRKEVERLVSLNAGQLRDCYEKALVKNSNLSGKLVVNLVIKEDGKPSDISIQNSTIRDPMMEQCIISRVSSWTFPKPTGGKTPLRFPFIFTASSKS